MSHPAGKHIGVGRSALWYGREVEGAWARVETPTAFIDAQLTDSQLHQLRMKIMEGNVAHVFLTENFHAWDWLVDKLIPVADGIMITIGTYPDRIHFLMNCDFIGRCSLMVRVDMSADWIHKLRPTDQVTVGVPYKLTTWLVRDGIRTEPDDYLGDNL